MERSTSGFSVSEEGVQPLKMVESGNCIQVEVGFEGKILKGTLMSLSTPVPRRKYFDCRPKKQPNIPHVRIVHLPPESDINERKAKEPRKNTRKGKKVIQKKRKNGLTYKKRKTMDVEKDPKNVVTTPNIPEEPIQTLPPPVMSTINVVPPSQDHSIRENSLECFETLDVDD